MLTLFAETIASVSVWQASGRSSPALRGKAQPAGASQRAAPRSINRAAADRVGARPR